MGLGEWNLQQKSIIDGFSVVKLFKDKQDCYSRHPPKEASDISTVAASPASMARLPSELPFQARYPF
jgi:hypothetical protein